MSEKLAAVMDKLTEDGAKKVKVAVCDLDGVLRGKLVHLDKFQLAAKSGLGFCSVVFGWDSSDICYDHVKVGSHKNQNFYCELISHGKIYQK